MLAGHSFLQSFEMMAQKTPQPLKKFLLPTIVKLHERESLNVALLSSPLNEVVQEYHTFSRLIPIFYAQGSHISDFLKQLEKNLRFKLQVEEKIKSQTAHVWVQVVVCTLLPWITLLGFYCIQPEMILDSLTDPLSQNMFLLALGLNLLGYLTLKACVKRACSV